LPRHTGVGSTLARHRSARRSKRCWHQVGGVPQRPPRRVHGAACACGARDERAARAHIRSERRTHARCGLHVRIRHFFASDLLLHASSACGRADGSARERACACGRRACVPHRRVLADEGLAEPLRRLEVHHAQVLRGKRHGCRYCGEVNRTRGCSELRRSRGFKVRNRCAQLCNE
jgi:hypothetical protein